MKQLMILFLTIGLAVGCNSTDKNTNDERDVREVAKQEVIDRLDLPKETKFEDKSVSVNRPNANEGDLDTEYIVKVTVTSQNRAGEKINKTHILHYKKREDAMAAKDRFELMSFE